MERKVLSLQDAKLYDASDDSPYGSFEGYGSVYGNYDRVNEAVAPGAFKNADEWLDSGFIANGHSWDALPIAYPVKLFPEDTYGFKFRANFHSTQAAQDARKVMQERQAAGKATPLSIGYGVNDAEETDKGRILKDLTLYEISTVNVPANALAGATAVKGLPLAGESFDEQTERVLATNREYVTRLRGYCDLKAADNRNVSAARRADIDAFESELIAQLKDIRELKGLIAPKADPKAARALAARILGA